jgi:paraquat-inducible protein B
MSHNANKYKLGVFVVVAFIILITSLFVLGALNIFKTRIPCITVVKGSVQGLAIGAKVKYNGVPIGEVTKIKVSPIGEHVYIYMNIFPENLDLLVKGDLVDQFRQFVTNETLKGLRCQLRYEGITGALYQEIQYFKLTDSNRTYKKPPLPEGHPIYIPSVSPVLFDSIMKRIDHSLAKLSGIDKIFNEVNEALLKINSFLDSDKVKNTINDFEMTSQNINSITNRINNTLTDEKIKSILNELEKTMSVTRELARNINIQLTETNFPATVSIIRDSIKETANKLNEAINNFNSAANSIELLSDEFNNSPNVLIWGEEKNKVVPSH